MYPRECVLSQLTRNEPLNFLAQSMHYARISLLLVKTKNKVSMHQDRRVRADEEGGLLAVFNKELIQYKSHNVLVII